MQKIFGYILAVVACCSAEAEAVRTYIRGNVSIPIYQSFKMDSKRYTPGSRLAGGGSVGMTFNPYFAGEVEGSFMSLPVKFYGAPGVESISSLRAFTVFGNIMFYPFGQRFGKLKPFFGLGIGSARVNMGGSSSNVSIAEYTTNPGSGGGFPQLIDKHTSQNISGGIVSRNVGYQGLLGVEYMFSDYLSLLADVRYVHLGKFKQNYTAVGEQDVITHRELVGRLKAVLFNFSAKVTW